MKFHHEEIQIMSDIQQQANIKSELVSDLTHTIASFLEWAETQKGLRLCAPFQAQKAHVSREQLLLEFFGIDMAMLESNVWQIADNSHQARVHYSN